MAVMTQDVDLSHLPVATGWDLFFHGRKLNDRTGIVLCLKTPFPRSQGCLVGADGHGYYIGHTFFVQSKTMYDIGNIIGFGFLLFFVKLFLEQQLHKQFVNFAR